MVCKLIMMRTHTVCVHLVGDFGFSSTGSNSMAAIITARSRARKISAYPICIHPGASGVTRGGLAWAGDTESLLTLACATGCFSASKRLDGAARGGGGAGFTGVRSCLRLNFCFF